MNVAIRMALVGALSAALTAPGLAQDASKPDAPKPDTSAPDTARPNPQDTPASTQAGTAAGAGQTGAAVPGSPDLTVATVKMEGGVRTSRTVGSAVFNGSNQQLGTVDDLIMNHDGKVVLAVISVGGLLGVGGKLVAVPFSTLHMDAAGKIALPDASKDSLSKMPGFTYNQ